MAGSVNKVILVGNVGGDPEIGNTSNGNQYAKFSLATSKTWRDKTTGERQEKTEWHRIQVWNEGLVKVVSSYVKKGDKLFIEGELQTRKWQDKEGNDRFSTEVVLSPYTGNLTMLSNKRGGGDTDADAGDGGTRASTSKAINKPAAKPAADVDDEIPSEGSES